MRENDNPYEPPQTAPEPTDPPVWHAAALASAMALLLLHFSLCTFHSRPRAPLARRG